MTPRETGVCWVAVACIVLMFVFCGCYNKVPQAGYLKETGIYSLSLLEARSLKSSVGRATVLQWD